MLTGWCLHPFPPTTQIQKAHIHVVDSNRLQMTRTLALGSVERSLLNDGCYTFFPQIARQIVWLWQNMGDGGRKLNTYIFPDTSVRLLWKVQARGLFSYFYYNIFINFYLQKTLEKSCSSSIVFNEQICKTKYLCDFSSYPKDHIIYRQLFLCHKSKKPFYPCFSATPIN